MRCAAIGLMWLLAAGAHAQDAGVPTAETDGSATTATTDAQSSPEATADTTSAGSTSAGSTSADAASADSTSADAATEDSTGTSADATGARAPKVAVVVVGDPDPLLVAAALELETVLGLSDRVRVPADPVLRGALRGDASTEDDGFAEVRRDRRRLGAGEGSDAALLAGLGRRAGAVLVLAVRSSASGAPEAVALDVGRQSYFEGALDLTEPTHEAIVSFAARRARAAASAASRGDTAVSVATPEQAAEAAVAGSATTDPPPAEPDWLSQNWPYLVAGALAAAGIVFVVVTQVQGDQQSSPMLRFVPGGR